MLIEATKVEKSHVYTFCSTVCALVVAFECAERPEECLPVLERMFPSMAVLVLLVQLLRSTQFKRLGLCVGEDGTPRLCVAWRLKVICLRRRDELEAAAALPAAPLHCGEDERQHGGTRGALRGGVGW